MTADDRKHAAWSRYADGLVIRYTQDPEPTIKLIETDDTLSPYIQISMTGAQMHAVAMAVNVYARIMTGDLQTIRDLVLSGNIKASTDTVAASNLAKDVGTLLAELTTVRFGNWVPSLPDADDLISLVNTELPITVQRVNNLAQALSAYIARSDEDTRDMLPSRLSATEIHGDIIQIESKSAQATMKM
jgi:hypothetical protein